MLWWKQLMARIATPRRDARAGVARDPLARALDPAASLLVPMTLAERHDALETIVTESERLQKIARSTGSGFLAQLLSSAHEEALTRLAQPAASDARVAASVVPLRRLRRPVSPVFSPGGGSHPRDPA